MNYIWYFIFNTDEFDALGLVSKNYQVIFEPGGLKNILVTKGQTWGLTYDDSAFGEPENKVFLSANLNGKNPLQFEDLAVYINADNDCFLGILVPDEN